MKIKFYSIFTLLLITFIMLIGCNTHNDFRGDMTTIEEAESYVHVKSQIIEIDSIHNRDFAVVDSMVFFYRTLNNKFFFDVFNMNNGIEIGKFCPIGQGHAEYLAISPITNVIKEGGNLKVILFAPNESKLLIWNISKSIEQNITVYDKIIDYPWRDKSISSYSALYPLGNDSLLTYMASVHIANSENITPSKYQVRSISSNHSLKDIQVFEVPQNIEDYAILPERFYSSSFCIRPNKKQFVEVMTYHPQINICDIETGIIKGYRFRTENENSLYRKDNSNVHRFYMRVQSTDNYIFALYDGCGLSQQQKTDGFKILHLFNWDGKMVKKVILEHPIHELFVDEANNLLYGVNANEQNLYCYYISDMTK